MEGTKTRRMLGDRTTFRCDDGYFIETLNRTSADIQCSSVEKKERPVSCDSTVQGRTTKHLIPLKTQVWTFLEPRGRPLEPCVRFCSAHGDCDEDQECTDKNTCRPRTCPGQVSKGRLVSPHGGKLSHLLNSQAEVVCDRGYVIIVFDGEEDEGKAEKRATVTCSVVGESGDNVWVLKNGAEAECVEGQFQLLFLSLVNLSPSRPLCFMQVASPWATARGQTPTATRRSNLHER